MKNPPQPLTKHQAPVTKRTAVTPWINSATAYASTPYTSRRARCSSAVSVLIVASSFSPCRCASVRRSDSSLPFFSSGPPGSTFQSQAGHHLVKRLSAWISVPH